MIEGSVPPSTLKPSLHAISHYPDHAELFGIIRWFVVHLTRLFLVLTSFNLFLPLSSFWMMSFERYNKYIKDLCFNKHWPMASVSKAYTFRAASHYNVGSLFTRPLSITNNDHSNISICVGDQDQQFIRNNLIVPE